MAFRWNPGTVRHVRNKTPKTSNRGSWSRLTRSRHQKHIASSAPRTSAHTPATNPTTLLAPEQYRELHEARFNEMREAWGDQGVVLSVLTASRTDATADQLAELAMLLPGTIGRKALCDCVNLLLGAKNADARVVRPLTLEEFSGVLRTSRPSDATTPVDSLDRLDHTFGLGFTDLFSRVVTSHNKLYTLGELLGELSGTEHAIPLVLRGWDNDAMTLPAVFARVRALPRTGAEIAAHLVLSGSEESFDDLCLMAESVLLTSECV